MTAVITLPARTGSVSVARRHALAALTGVAGPDAERVALVVSELVTNAVLHAGTDVRLAVSATGSSVRIEVTDDGAGRADLRSPTPEDPHGRGLQIVSMLASDWGVQRSSDGPGKTVWCELPVQARELAHH